MALTDMIDTVRDYMDKEDWRYEYDDSKKMIRAGVNLKGKLQSVRLYLLFNEKGYSCTAVCPMKADEATRVAAMEYITRANYGLRNGNFELDMRDGEVRYKCYVSYKGLDTLPEPMIEESLVIPVLMFERYGDGLAAIMFGFSTPEAEIERVEGKK